MTRAPVQSEASDYAALPEGELVRLARAGQRAAFAAIMQRCNQRLFRVARSVLRDEVEAEDVLQDAYINAFRKLDSFRGDSSLLTWLTTITLNEARARLRRRRESVSLDSEPAPQEESRVIMFPTAAGMDPESSAARAQMRRLLERAIDALPEPFRLVFVMREIEECSIEETAAQLGIKPETVKTRLHRARRLMREAVDQEMARSLRESFPFLGARCARLTENVLQRLAIESESVT